MQPTVYSLSPDACKAGHHHRIWLPTLGGKPLFGTLLVGSILHIKYTVSTPDQRCGAVMEFFCCGRSPVDARCKRPARMIALLCRSLALTVCHPLMVLEGLDQGPDEASFRLFVFHQSSSV